MVKKKNGALGPVFIDALAERVGFEPTVPCGTPDFESGTFGHSATSPTSLILSGSQYRHATHVGLQHFRDDDAAVGLLVILVTAAVLNFATQRH